MGKWWWNIVVTRATWLQSRWKWHKPERVSWQQPSCIRTAWSCRRMTGTPLPAETWWGAAMVDHKLDFNSQRNEIPIEAVEFNPCHGRMSLTCKWFSPRKANSIYINLFKSSANMNGFIGGIFRLSFWSTVRSLSWIILPQIESSYWFYHQPWLCHGRNISKSL